MIIIATITNIPTQSGKKEVCAGFHGRQLELRLGAFPGVQWANRHGLGGQTWQRAGHEQAPVSPLRRRRSPCLTMRGPACYAKEAGLYPQGKEEHLKDLKQPDVMKCACVEDPVERDETRGSKTREGL